MIGRGNKYNARGCRFNGIWYNSQAEGRYAERLELLLKAGEINWYGAHPTVSIPTGSSAVIKWKIDFHVVKNDGIEYYVEYKGFATPDYKLKLELYRANADKLPSLFVVREGNRIGEFRIIDEINPQGVKYI